MVKRVSFSIERVSFRTKHVLFCLLLAAGCKDDRRAVASDVFLCSATSHTADYDCGDGYLCYTGTQALGASLCVPRCDPAHADKTCPGGLCTAAHECLTRCTVGDPKACGGGAVLSCVRTTYSPLEAKKGNDGVCAPVAYTCTTTADCGSPVYNLCTSDTDGQQDNDQLLKTGSVCAQGGCKANGVACEPGSTCILNILPASVTNAPDVCVPNCQRRTLPNDGGVFDECPVGFTCIDQVFPQNTARVCTPGFPGFICRDPLGCAAGTCAPWSDVGGPFDGFTTCSPACDDDKDCLIYDRPGNPDILSHFTCTNGQCRHLQSLLFTGVCNHDGDQCALDPQATCHLVGASGPPPDAGAGDDCLLSLGAQPLGMGSNGALCQRTCQSDSDCGTLSANAHVTYACVSGTCTPSVPFLFPCTNDQSCVPGLNCLAPPNAPPGYRVCTHACTSTADCAQNPSLGSNFACALNLCVPKTSSGCAPPLPTSDLCLSGQLDPGGLCLSPAGWICDKDKRCLSGKCVGNHCQ
jgi:hypothetical protein